MSFRDIAIPLIARGIPVVPVEAAGKRCRLSGWPDLATTQLETIEFWDASNPSANVGAVAKRDGIIVLDCDVPVVPEQIAAATGHALPATFTVLSGGRHCPHYYYTHTDRSRALGNRKLPGHWDLKAHNAYVVGPGSVIATDGGPRAYEILDAAEIQPIPDWLVEWIERVTVPEKRNGECRTAQPIAEKFDIHAFLDHYGLDYEMKGDWYVTDRCPVAGRKHEQSTETGFFYNGQSFGFKCFAANCPGSDMSVGDVIKHLNKGDGLKLVAPYTGEIWPKPETPPDPEVASAEWFEPLEQFMVKLIPPRKKLMSDIETGDAVLFSESVNQIFSFRGIGKSLFAAGLVNVLVNGGEFLRYTSRGGNRVLYCDGELPDSVLQDRLRAQLRQFKSVWLMHAGSLPNQTFPKLGDVTWQAEFLKRVEALKPDVIVFDTLTACFRFDTNDSDSWERVNQFYITLRHKGYCVLIIHHAGKNGTQRGRSDGDDNLDLVMRLDAPKDWAPGDGCRFKLSYEKVRAGSRLTEFHAAYENDTWKIQEAPEESQIMDLLVQGKSIRSIAALVDMPKSSVHRIAKRLKEKGLLAEVKL